MSRTSVPPPKPRPPRAASPPVTAWAPGQRRIDWAHASSAQQKLSRPSNGAPVCLFGFFLGFPGKAAARGEGAGVGPDLILYSKHSGIQMPGSSASAERYRRVLCLNHITPCLACVGGGSLACSRARGVWLPLSQSHNLSNTFSQSNPLRTPSQLHRLPY